jgi:hypothetical protein
MTKIIEIEAKDERQLVRSVHRNAHCRPSKTGKGFFIYRKDDNGVLWPLGFDFNTRAAAWIAAARIIGQKMLDKLEL